MATEPPEYTDEQMIVLLDEALDMFDEEIYFRVASDYPDTTIPAMEFVLPLLTTIRLARSALAMKEEHNRIH